MKNHLPARSRTARFAATLALLASGFAAADLQAATFGNFTYTANATAVTITGFNTSYSGALEIPESINGLPVVEIASDAFWDCQLTSVTIPSGLAKIDPRPFYSCTALQSITVNATNVAFSSANGVLFDKAGTTLLKFPQGKSGIYAIPNGVEEVSGVAFWNSNGLASVTIPASVTTIGDYAFGFCYGLKSVLFLGDAPSVGWDVFGDPVKTSDNPNPGPNYSIHVRKDATGFTLPKWEKQKTSYGYSANLIGLVGNQSTSATPEEFPQQNGLVTLTLTQKGLFTGAVALGGKKIPVTGTYTLDGAAGGNAKAGISLTFTCDQIGLHSGEVKILSSNKTLAFSAAQFAYTGGKDYNSYSHLGSMKKNLNVFLQSTGIPDGNLTIGHGFAMVTPAKDGSAKFAGVLPDGSKITGSSRATFGPSGLVLPVAISIPTTRGLLCGELTETEPTFSQSIQRFLSGSLDGTLVWVRGQVPKATAYPSGFICEMDAFGTQWYPWSGKNPLSASGSGDASFTLTVDPSASLLTSPISQTGTWPATNKPVLAALASGVTGFTYSQKTGVFTGKVQIPAKDSLKPQTVILQGLLTENPLQDDGSTQIHGVGFLLGTEKSVPVEISSVSANITSSQFSMSLLGGNVTVQRYGTGSRGVVFFNNSGPMDTQIAGAISQYAAVLGNDCSIFVWSYPNASPFDQVQAAISSWMNGSSIQLDFTGVATQVVAEIRKATGLQKLLLVGNSLGGGVLLWDYPALSADPDLRFLLVSPTEMFMPDPSTLKPLSKGILIANKSGDPFVSSADLKTWIAANRTTYSGSAGHFILGQNFSHGDLVQYINLALTDL